MYQTRVVHGIPVIERNGQLVLCVCDHNRDFADWLCELLNQLGHKSTRRRRKPELLLTDCDVEWLRLIDCAFEKELNNA